MYTKSTSVSTQIAQLIRARRKMKFTHRRRKIVTPVYLNSTNHTNHTVPFKPKKRKFTHVRRKLKYDELHLHNQTNTTKHLPPIKPRKRKFTHKRRRLRYEDQNKNRTTTHPNHHHHHHPKQYKRKSFTHRRNKLPTPLNQNSTKKPITFIDVRKSLMTPNNSQASNPIDYTNQRGQLTSPQQTANLAATEEYLQNQLRQRGVVKLLI